MSHIVIEGNLAADPEAGVSAAGVSWSRFRVITNDRYTDRNDEWVDGPPVSWQVAAFRRLGENISDSLHTGDRVIISGRLTIKGYRDKDGNERTSRDVVAEHVGVDLSRATVTVTKNPRSIEAADHNSTAAGDQNPPPDPGPQF